MRGPTYTEQELLALKESPLVQKPDGLPSILQWMDVPADQTTNNGQASNNGTVRRTRGMRDGEAGAANEQRPLINPVMGQFGRRQSMRKSEAQGIKAAINALFVEPGEDTVLGPPKLSFLSASRTALKAAGDAKERTGIAPVDGDMVGDRREKNDRWARDRDADRTRDKGYANGRRVPREDGEGWTNVKGRKSLGQEDFERFGRNGDRNREKHEGDAETDVAPRRANRERTEARWGRREEGKEEVTKTGVQGGWRERDRERDRERENGREWNRGTNRDRHEEDPEWMDTKAEKKEFQPRTQEDFQRWKEEMRAKDTPSEDRNETRDVAAEISTAFPIAAPPILTAPLHTPSTEPTQGLLFGNWGRDTAAETSPAETVSAKPRPDKKSRFMNMFAKPEEPAAPSPAPAHVPAPPAPAMEANADKEGFQRILQMLGQVNMGGVPTVQPGIPTPTNGARIGGGVSLDFHQQSSPPEPQHGRPPPRTMEQQSMLENILTPRPSAPESRPSQQSRFNSMSPDNAPPEQFRLPRPDSNHPEDHFPHQQPPPRNNPHDANLHALLNSRAREEAQRDQATKQRERDFLLNLMQLPSRATPPQIQNQNLPRPTQENHNMAFYEQPRQHPQHPQHQPKVRGALPPGYMEDPRMYSENDMMRREAAAERAREHELRQQLMQQQQQEAIRAKNSRMPMGFPNHEDPLMGLQRRNTAGDPRMPTNMGIPSQPVPDMQYMGGRGQPGMPPTPQERPNIAPPPGFGGAMRQPPGLGGPNPQQMGPGVPSFSAGNTPLGHPGPSGFPPGGNIRGLGFPGGPGGPNGNGMQGPPGYFPQPGYGPPMPNMRGGEDPRMMFDGQFGGPPRQQPGRPGPPNMY
ncbi:hypothetical protein EJ02DRAFT_398471 [Clathrospora elynae]|uniref:Uncharacterized protein n=1 Tax=Clathrospora elynae TaxID=706981 RepID=A0A6A5SX95_9PLEO|nr:hypothetical protein EJ02DRAFT_398471 [Clathrospora elynae]